MAKDKKGSKPASKKVFDFTNVKERGNIAPKHVPAGDYLAVIDKVEELTSKEGNPMWLVIFKGASAGVTSATYPYYCVLNPDNLWKLRNVAVAAGLTVPKKRMEIDPKDLLGKTVGITLDDEEYEGKMKSVIMQVMPASEVTADLPDADENSEEVDTGKKAKKGKKDAKPAKGKKGKSGKLEEIDVDEV